MPLRAAAMAAQTPAKPPPAIQRSVLSLMVDIVEGGEEPHAYHVTAPPSEMRLWVLPVPTVVTCPNVPEVTVVSGVE